MIVIEPGAFRTDFLEASSLVPVDRAIEDYSGTAGVTRRWADEMKQGQQGDPVKAAAAIVTVATAADIPFRLQLGTDCLARVEAKLSQVADELAKWRTLAESTDYEQTTKDLAA